MHEEEEADATAEADGDGDTIAHCDHDVPYSNDAQHSRQQITCMLIQSILLKRLFSQQIWAKKSCRRREH